MKQLILLLISTILLSACSELLTKKEIASTRNVQLSSDPIEVYDYMKGRDRVFAHYDENFNLSLRPQINGFYVVALENAANGVMPVQFFYQATHRKKTDRALVQLQVIKGEKPSIEVHPKGDVIGWYETGEKESEKIYIDGVAEGIWTEWYKNGQKKIEQHYEHGLIIQETEWDENGVVIVDEE